jgi:hypothetical protein
MKCIPPKEQRDYMPPGWDNQLNLIHTAKSCQFAILITYPDASTLYRDYYRVSPLCLVPKDNAWKNKYQEPAAPDKSDAPQFPEGWCITSLDQVSNKITDGEHLSPQTRSSGVPLLSAKDVREHGVLFDDPKFVSNTDALRFRQRCHPEFGDVLIVSRGATIGRTTMVQTNFEFCLMGSVILVKPCQPISGRFLATFLLNHSALSVQRFVQGLKVPLLKDERVVFTIAWIAMVFQILLHHLFGDVARAPSSVTYRPEVFAPVAPLQLGVLLLEQA